MISTSLTRSTNCPGFPCTTPFGGSSGATETCCRADRHSAAGTLVIFAAPGVFFRVSSIFYTKREYCSTTIDVKGEHIGEFEEMILLAVLALTEPAYAVPVQRFIENKAERAVSMGAVYAALGRLEIKGLLRSGASEATPRRGGKRKRLYEVTPSGLRTLRELRHVRDRIWRTIEEQGR